MKKKAKRTTQADKNAEALEKLNKEVADLNESLALVRQDRDELQQRYMSLHRELNSITDQRNEARQLVRRLELQLANEQKDRQQRITEPPKQISVLDCCGVFGWSIPWAEFKARTLPVVPTRETNRPYFYLFSIAGQMGDQRNIHTIVPKGEKPENCINAVNIDPAIGKDGKVDWDWVLREMENEFRGYFGISQRRNDAADAMAMATMTGPLRTVSGLGPLRDLIAGRPRDLNSSRIMEKMVNQLLGNLG